MVVQDSGSFSQLETMVSLGFGPIGLSGVTECNPFSEVVDTYFSFSIPRICVEHRPIEGDGILFQSGGRQLGRTRSLRRIRHGRATERFRSRVPAELALEEAD